MIEVRQATPADLNVIAPLFDAYRQFYGKPPDLALATHFLRQRFENGESVIFLALQPDGSAVGFTQLYPTFSSGAAARIFVLNDLFVVPNVRRSGVGTLLLAAAAEFGRFAGAVRLTLVTELANLPAQTLYEREGWIRDITFCTYNLPL